MLLMALLLLVRVCVGIADVVDRFGVGDRGARVGIDIMVGIAVGMCVRVCTFECSIRAVGVGDCHGMWHVVGIGVRDDSGERHDRGIREVSSAISDASTDVDRSIVSITNIASDLAITVDIVIVVVGVVGIDSVVAICIVIASNYHHNYHLRACIVVDIQVCSRRVRHCTDV